MAKIFKELRENLKKDYSAFPSVRLAVLADWSAQFLSQALRGRAYESGISLDIYEGACGQFEAEILDAKSGLYAFEPDFVLLFPSSEGLRDRFYDLEDRKSDGMTGGRGASGGPRGLAFAEAEAKRLKELAERLGENVNAQLILCNYCELDDAVYGNLGAIHEDSILRIIRNLNERLARELAAPPEAGKEGVSAPLIADINTLQNAKGSENAFDPRLYYISESIFGFDFLALIADRILGIMDALSGRARKCLITDLDGTLWGGIIGDAGIEGIQIGELGGGRAFRDLQKWIRELSRRGVAVAVCSKNDEDTAKAPFLKHPDMALRLDDISLFVANWNDKASNIRFISERLNIGLDSMVFIDDSPAERELVRKLLPEVAVPELPGDASLVPESLRKANFFETAAVLDEDRRRTRMYGEESRRAETAAKAADIGEYLESLRMRASFEPFDAFLIPRAAQLTQRSNQFNLRTKRYTAPELWKFAGDSDYLTRCLSLSDRFGDYGTVGVVILERRERGAALFLDTLLMSCRILKRGAEEFMFNELVSLARDEGAEFLTGEYLPTAKNGPVAGLLASFGFLREEELWRLKLSDYAERPTYVRRKT